MAAIFQYSTPPAQRKRWAFEPYQPPPIPAGWYDPALDAQRQAASRGLLNTEQDIGTAGRRASEDLKWENQGLERQFQRGQVDYQRNVEMLTRRYGQLAGQQREQAAKYGVTSGGIALLSAARRSENMALERRDLDTQRDRMQEDVDRAIQRNRDLYDRGVADRGDQLSRARSEDQFFGLDVDAQRQYQAQQAGYDAPTGPSNEFTRPDGTRYRVIRSGGWRLEVDQNGRVLNRRRVT